MTTHTGPHIVVGVDPGPIPGVVGLLIEDVEGVSRVTDVQLAQVTPGLIGLTLGGVVMRWKQHPHVPYHRDTPVLIAVEKFVVSRRSGRSSSAGAGATTRDMVGVIDRFGEEMGAPVVQRPAVLVKGWATDERLVRAGLETPSGMRHARDACRHALYAACHAEFLPDPMSRAYKKPSL